MTAWCADCRAAVELDRHLRCSQCGSDAIDSLERQPQPRPAHPMKQVFDYMLAKMEGRA